MEITHNDWARWKSDPVTKEVFQILMERQGKIAHGLATGNALVPIEREVLVGRYQEIQDLLSMDYEDTKPAKEE